MKKEKEKERAIQLHKNWQEFQNKKHAGITALPMDQKYTHYHALIKSPPNSPFKNGFFRVCVRFLKEYPFKREQVRIQFLTPVYHPAVYSGKFQELKDFPSQGEKQQICYPSVFKIKDVSLFWILTRLRYDFLTTPNTFFHTPANEQAFKAMFKPSPARKSQLKFRTPLILYSSHFCKKIEFLTDIATVIGNTNRISKTIFNNMIKNGAFDELASFLKHHEKQIRAYAKRRDLSYPKSVSEVFRETLDFCRVENYLDNARKIFLNSFLMKFFTLFFYQSVWWEKASKITEKHAKLKHTGQTFEKWECHPE